MYLLLASVSLHWGLLLAVSAGTPLGRDGCSRLWGQSSLALACWWVRTGSSNAAHPAQGPGAWRPASRKGSGPGFEAQLGLLLVGLGVEVGGRSKESIRTEYPRAAPWVDYPGLM